MAEIHFSGFAYRKYRGCIDENIAVSGTFDIIHIIGDISSIGGGVADLPESFFFPEKFIKSSFCSNSEVTLPVHRNTKNPVIGDGCCISRFIGKHFECIPVELVETILRPDPDVSFRVLENTIDYRLRQAVVDGIPCEEELLGVAAQAGENEKNNKSSLFYYPG